ncbi:MAG: hypothetical protein LBS59_08605 [Puniceicoccales bacterium]|jgi:hypothetical protein|nr:hypothetical protein [Puniceicoccales bacterium]
MQTTRRFLNQSKIPFPAALFTAFCLLFLPGCKKEPKTPEEHARFALRPGLNGHLEKRLASVEALAAANEQMLLVRVAADSRVPDVKHAAASKLNDPRAMVAFAKKVHQTDGTGAELAAEVMGKLTDRHLLTDIAANASSMFVRIEAAALLDDQALLASSPMTKRPKEPSVRRRLAGRPFKPCLPI